MKYLVATLLTAVTLAANPAGVIVSGANASALCGPGGPEAYNRPGGYCEQLQDLKSLGSQENEDECVFLHSGLLSRDAIAAGTTIQVAELCYDPCMTYASLIDPVSIEPGTRVRLAIVACAI